MSRSLPPDSSPRGPVSPPPRTSRPANDDQPAPVTAAATCAKPSSKPPEPRPARRTHSSPPATPHRPTTRTEQSRRCRHSQHHGLVQHMVGTGECYHDLGGDYYDKHTHDPARGPSTPPPRPTRSRRLHRHPHPRRLNPPPTHRSGLRPEHPTRPAHHARTNPISPQATGGLPADVGRHKGSWARSSGLNRSM